MYNILEVANTHAGDFNYVISLIEEFKEYKENIGIKFQPLKYDEISLPDFSHYSVYEELYFDSKQWGEIIDLSYKTKEVWIDIFDLYSIKIIEENFDKIKGFKLQSSILFNKKVLNSFAKLKLQGKKIILNISGYKIEEIQNIIEKFNTLFPDSKILLQVGFQGYPTMIEDSGIVKIKELQSHFNNDLVFADHIDAKSKDSIWLPIFAAMQGVKIIEKHIKHSSLETKYDFYSSINCSQFKNYLEELNKYTSLFNNEFITNAEKIYLQKSDQIPVLDVKKRKGSLLAWEDFSFKRTDEVGLSTRLMEKYISDGYILNKAKNQNATILKEDLIKPVIATIIAVRLKSTRLKSKALKKIGDLTSIEYCIKNALKFDNINHTIVATSDLDSDAELEKYTYSESVIFHKGHPDDVIKRYLDIINKLKINIFVRITGDNPFVSNEIVQILLNSHLNSGADYTAAKEATIGTNIEIISSAALQKVQDYFPIAEYSEYMTWYFQNNPNYFKLNFVDLPKNLIRNYRLTLDYDEDLTLFNKIENYFQENGIQFSLSALYEFLDNNPEIANINSNIAQTYKTDSELMEKLNKATKIDINK